MKTKTNYKNETTLTSYYFLLRENWISTYIYFNYRQHTIPIHTQLILQNKPNQQHTQIIWNNCNLQIILTNFTEPFVTPNNGLYARSLLSFSSGPILTSGAAPEASKRRAFKMTEEKMTFQFTRSSMSYCKCCPLHWESASCQTKTEKGILKSFKLHRQHEGEYCVIVF